MSSDFNSVIRRSGTLDRKTLNKLIEELAESFPPIEDEGGAVGFISLMDELRVRTTNVTMNDGDFKMSESRDKEGSHFIRDFAKNPAAYPLTHATVGDAISFPTAGHKYGAIALFNDNQHIKINHHSQIDNLEPWGLVIFFKTPNGQRHGKHVIYCKRDISNNTNAGIEIWIEGNVAADYNSTNFNSTNYSQTIQTPTIYVRISDGTNTVLFSQTVSALYDEAFHSIFINIENNDADYNSTNFNATNYHTAAGNRQVEVFVDKVSIGTADLSSLIVGSMVNSRAAYIGALDNAGVIQNMLAAAICYMFIQSKAYSSAEITSYHDNARMNTDSEKTSVHFAGDETENSNPTIDS